MRSVLLKLNQNKGGYWIHVLNSKYQTKFYSDLTLELRKTIL